MLLKLQQGASETLRGVLEKIAKGGSYSTAEGGALKIAEGVLLKIAEREGC